MMMVFASGMSRPFSTIVVETKTSNSWRMKPRQDTLQFFLIHLAVADADAHVR